VSYHTAIVNYFLEQAKRRNQQAAESPDDARSAQGAAALRGLTGYVLRLPEDDERLRELGALAVRDGVFTPFEEGQRLISRYGFDDPDPDADGFLRGLAAVTRREAPGFAQEHGAPPSEG
jgi:hypothetical protein